MKRYKTILIIPLICLGMVSHEDALAEEMVPDDSLCVSENSAAGGSVSEDTVSENEIPEEDISRIEISGTKVSYDGRSAVIEVSVACEGSSFIKLIQAENAGAGIKKELYHAEEGVEDKIMTVRLRTRSNGIYVFHAYDTKNNAASCNVPVDEAGKGSFSSFAETAKGNASGSINAHASAVPVIYGCPDKKGTGAVSLVQGYSVKSKDKDSKAEPSDTEKYGQWSLLRDKGAQKNARAWYEPCIDDEDDPVTGSEDVLPGLSDYSVSLFKAGLKSPESAVLGSVSKPDETLPDLNFNTPDDNIDAMDSNNSIIIIGIVIFIIILLMIIAAFLLLKSHKSGGKKKKAKIKVKSRTKAPVVKNASARKSPASVKAGSSVKKPEKTVSKPVPLKGAGDEGIEKYARMTEDYARSKFGIELQRVDLKKYYSDRHGFDCVDFTYKPASGVLPADFRIHLNDVDTALSNVSGVDTITFAMYNATGTYRTTFYKV